MTSDYKNRSIFTMAVKKKEKEKSTSIKTGAALKKKEKVLISFCIKQTVTKQLLNDKNRPVVKITLL